MHPHLPSSTSRIYCSGHLYVTIHACVLNTYIDLTFTDSYFDSHASDYLLPTLYVSMFYYFLVVNCIIFNDKDRESEKKRCKIFLLVLQQISDEFHKMREIISSRAISYVRGDKIKNDAFSRKFHFSEKFRK